ncbi:MAG: hypothetical protein OXN16_03025 [Gammaproteobacteria bacterium]|nr:hypothetical protein [Gammaproteobacteria bacterium]
MDGCAYNEPHALQVTDSSMEPECPKSCVIISEPNGVLENSCYVIRSDGGELVFRQLPIVTPMITGQHSRSTILTFVYTPSAYQYT